MDSIVFHYYQMESNIGEVALKVRGEHINRIMNTMPWHQRLQCGCVFNTKTCSYQTKCQEHNQNKLGGM